MLQTPIQSAIEQVRDLKSRVLELQLFRGYSGTARAAAGLFTLFAAFLMSRSFFPPREIAHVIGWGLVFIVGTALNYGALVYWFFSQRAMHKPFTFRPVLDGVTPLLVGGILTFAMLARNQYDLLFGMWMCLFGLAHLASRQSLPKAIWYLGWYYVACGAGYFIFVMDRGSFLNPWPMSTVFCIGEIVGGVIFYYSAKSEKEKFDA